MELGYPESFSILAKCTISYYTSGLKCGIKKLPCCVRDAVRPVLSQQIFTGFHIRNDDAIGPGQGEVVRVNPTLRLQVQNYAAHGTVGFF